MVNGAIKVVWAMWDVENSSAFPGLFYCVKKLYFISVSSTPVESLFSEAVNQVTDARNPLAPEKVNKMMVISEYYSTYSNSSLNVTLRKFH